LEQRNRKFCLEIYFEFGEIDDFEFEEIYFEFEEIYFEFEEDKKHFVFVDIFVAQPEGGFLLEAEMTERVQPLSPTNDNFNFKCQMSNVKCQM